MLCGCEAWSFTLMEERRLRVFENRILGRINIEKLLILQLFFVPLIVGRHRGIIANVHIRICSDSYEKVKSFKYLGSLETNQNSIQEGEKK